MKTKWIALIVVLASLFSMRAATNDLTTLLQKGLFEEEANHNLEAAMQAYQSAIAEHDKDRKLVATAVFRLGECYRKQGKTNEAFAQYQRVLREFPEQDPLVKLSKNYLGQGAGVQLAQSSAAIATTSEEDEEVRAIKAMIQNSPDLIDAAPPNGKTPLQGAAEKGHLKTAEYLLANGADVNKGARSGVTGPPIYLAARNGHKAMVELLLARGAKIEKTDALSEAASRGFKGVVETLIAAKADVNEGSPLFEAASHGSVAVAEVLIAAKADVNLDSPLRAAASSGSLPIVEMLISNKADVNARDSYGRTPLLQAGDLAIARLLIANGAEVNAKTSGGETPLFLAVSRGDIKITRLLLENGADPEIIAERWWNEGREGASSALGRAISGSSANSEMVELLLNAHANPNARFGWRDSGSSNKQYGYTPLNLAIKLNKPEMVELLLARGADPDLRTDSGLIPITHAIGQNEKGIVQSLIKYKAKLDLKVNARPLLLYAAGISGRAAIVDLLCRSGLNVNERDDQGSTALHIAVMILASDTVEVLIARGADINALDNEGKPPLAYTKPRPGTSWGNSNIELGEAIAEILRKAGANENYERLTKIWVKEHGQSYPQAVFYKGTNSVNRYSVVELIGYLYRANDPNGNIISGIPYPDLTKLVINRLKSDGTTNRIPVDLIGILQANDRSKDVWLQWGDIVDIPEEDHKVGESWPGLSLPVTTALQKAMLRQVDVLIKGVTNRIALYPASGRTLNWAVPEGFSGKGMRNVFFLKDTLKGSGLLLISSDLSRVRVTRAKPVGEEPREMVFDETKTLNPDLWLRDGDVIEVPERDPSAPVPNAPFAPRNSLRLEAPGSPSYIQMLPTP